MGKKWKSEIVNYHGKKTRLKWKKRKKHAFYFYYFVKWVLLLYFVKWVFLLFLFWYIEKLTTKNKVNALTRSPSWQGSRHSKEATLRHKHLRWENELPTLLGNPRGITITPNFGHTEELKNHLLSLWFLIHAACNCKACEWTSEQHFGSANKPTQKKWQLKFLRINLLIFFIATVYEQTMLKH